MSCVDTRTAPPAALKSYTQIEYSMSGEGRTMPRERELGRGACRIVLTEGACFEIPAIVRSMMRRGSNNTVAPCTTAATSSVAAIHFQFRAINCSSPA